MNMLAVAALVVVLVVLLLAAYGLIQFVRFWIRSRSPRGGTASEAREPTSAASSSSEDSAQDAPPFASTTRASFNNGPALGTDPSFSKKLPSFMSAASISIHCIVIVLMTLVLLLPLNFVTQIIEERSGAHQHAIRAISQSWGKEQTVHGPALIIPFVQKRSHTEKRDGKFVTYISTTRKYRVIFPKTLNFEADIAPERRAYGIYEYVVYASPIKASGTFQIPAASSEFGDDIERIEWNNAWFVVGLTDTKAILSVDPLVWNGAPTPPYAPGTRIPSLFSSGFHAPLPLNPAKDAGAQRSFSFSAVLRGSGGMHFTPVGETTQITLSGAWPHPKFSGAVLPKERTIGPERFSASWHIPHLSRSYPQALTLANLDEEFQDGRRRSHASSDDEITQFVAGVELFEPVRLYTQMERAIKYAILFIGLTFIALLSFELAFHLRLHLMQYGLVGIAMVVFYLVLLSLAEHTPFINAFLAASAVSTLMNSAYMASAMRSLSKGGIIAVLLALLYAFLYAILQMEDHALLIGTALVVSVTGILMFLTRNLSHGSVEKT